MRYIEFSVCGCALFALLTMTLYAITEKSEFLISTGFFVALAVSYLILDAMWDR